MMMLMFMNMVFAVRMRVIMFMLFVIVGMDVLMRVVVRSSAVAMVVRVIGIMLVVFVIMGMNVLMRVAMRPVAVAVIMDMLMRMDMSVSFLTRYRRLAASANRAH